MRSKNLLPVQVILPQNQKSMGSNHSARKGAFEEALQSTIEASLRSSGTVPSHVFSSLYHRCRPLSNDPRPGPSLGLLPPPDNCDNTFDVKPDISGLNRDLLRQTQQTPSNSEERKSSPGTPSNLPGRTQSAHSSPREQPTQLNPFVTPVRGPPPLLLTMPPNLLRTNTPVQSSNSMTQASNGNRFLPQRLPTMLTNNMQLEQLKQVQAEQLKHLQQIQRWNLLQHQRAAVSSMQIPRIPFFNPLLPPSALNRNPLLKPGSSINGVHGAITESSATTDPTSPSSPMFRKGFCKGGKDIRLSTLKRDGSFMAPCPTEYTLVAMSISPSSPQVTTSTGTFQPPDIPSEAIVVVAISLKCLPPQQQEMNNPLMAQCIGCGDGSLHTFALLSSHINLRTTPPSQSATNLTGTNPLQRHARNFVLRDGKMPHGCIRGAMVPWRVNSNGNRVQSSLPNMASIYMTANQQAVARGTNQQLSVAMAREQGTFRPQTNAQFPILPQKQSWKYKHGERNAITRPGPLTTQIKPQYQHSLTPGLSNHAQPTTSQASPILIQSPHSANSSPKQQQKSTNDWSPISAGPSSHSPTSDALTQSRSDPDWNSTVKFPENLPEHVGRPLVMICWEWQQLHSNIQNVHITHTYSKCFDEAFTETHDPSIAALSREMCYMITMQYLASLERHEFPTISALSAWIGRSRQMFSTMRQIQLTTAHAVSLARMTITNQPHKIGLVVSQISQAHAINECIASLKPHGPDYHVIAHINGDTILDLCILLTGHVSRLTREHLLTADEYSDFVDQIGTSNNTGKFQEKLSVSHLEKFITNLSSVLQHQDLNIKNSFVSMTTHEKHLVTQATSSNFTSQVYTNPTVLDGLSSQISTSVSTPVHNISDENNNCLVIKEDPETVSSQIAEQLFNHVSSICEDHTKLDLSLFTSVRCSFLLPPSPVCQSEAIADVTESGIMQQLGLCTSSKPSQTDFRKMFFTTSSKMRQRFNALCEHVKVNTSTLFLLFHLDSHLHCDTNSVGSEWMSSSISELFSNCPNVLLVSSTHIPQALLNQNTSISDDNVIFCVSSMCKGETSSSVSDHCSPPPPQDFCRNMTFDPEYEFESISLLNSIPHHHSAMVNSKLLTRQYVAALTSIVCMHQILSTGRSAVPGHERLHDLTTPTTLAIMKDLISSTTGITVLLRVSSEALASTIVSELTEARRKLHMQEAFEIMLYASHMKPRISEHFLQIIRKSQNKPIDWTPERLKEIDCIPLFVIYTGKDICSHLMPRSLRYVDLRLAANNMETLAQSFFLSEMALASGCYKVSMTNQSVTVKSETSTEPSEKKRKTDDEDDDSLKMDVFSEESGSNDEGELKWRTLDEKSAVDSLRKLSNCKDNEINEFSSEDERETSPQLKPNRKRGHPSPGKSKCEDSSTIPSISTSPRVILSRSMFNFMESYSSGTVNFSDLPPHFNCEWISHARPAINERLSGRQMSEYLRKWARPLQGHPDYKPEGREEPQCENSRHILLVTPPRSRVPLACCIFTKKMNNMLLKLMQVKVYDHRSSITVKPCYPMPNSQLLPKWPVYSAIQEMEFVATVDNSCSMDERSQIMNGVHDLALMDPDIQTNERPTAPCMAGRLCAFDLSHRSCSSCQSYSKTSKSSMFTLSLPNCGINQHTVCDGTMSLDVDFVTPDTQWSHFVFQRRDESNASLQALNLSSMNAKGVKTPVFSLGVSGPNHGLYNLDHTLFAAEENPHSGKTELGSLKIDEGTSKTSGPLHVIVVRHCDSEEFKSCWPNQVLMILPPEFDELGIGAMKYAVQCVMHHSVHVNQEQHNAFAEASESGDVWPFALLLDDASVVWTSCNLDEMGSLNNYAEEASEMKGPKEWKNLSLQHVLKRIEAVPSVERFAAIGVRPWTSQMEIPKCSEDFSGVALSSKFSKCHLTTCVALNVLQTKDVMFDYARFMNDDIDWCMRVASADLPIFRFNDIAVATKVMSSPSRDRLTSVDCEKFPTLVSLADSEIVPIPRHPHLLLELYLGKSGDDVFPKSKGNATHPVLVVDHYFSLGSEVRVEFASSRSDTTLWATNSDKRYCGLLLYCPSGDVSQEFLQLFSFTTGATVCVVGRDRSSLRQAVVKLHLENDWHFRLTDEYQTTNDTRLQKPLYYLTGVSRNAR